MIPAAKEEEIPDGSKTVYKMTAADGANVDSVSDLTEDAANASYTVTAAPSDTRFGMVLGGGTFRYGDFAQLEATLFRSAGATPKTRQFPTRRFTVSASRRTPI